MNRIYFDSAATSHMHEEVIDEMVKAMRSSFGNPSSTHFFGRESKGIIENVRKKLAKHCGVSSSEICFTSCGTEANNLVIRSCVDYLGIKHIISSPMEHKCVINTLESMDECRGIKVDRIKILPDGDYDYEDLEEKLKNASDKVLVSLMHANNEVGNLYDLAKIGALCKKYDAYFHSDMVQTLGHFPIDLKDSPVHFASSSAHKFHGPKGIGFAYIQKGTGLRAQITGGGQERNMRSGTENVYGIAGMGKAFDMATESFEEDRAYILSLKEHLIRRLSSAFPNIKFNGKSADLDNSLYTLVNISLPFKDNLIGFELDLKGISASQGSACSSGAASVSLVLQTLLDDETINTTTPLRISFSKMNTKDEIDYLVDSLIEIEAKQKKREFA